MELNLDSRWVSRRTVLKSAVFAGGSLLATSLLAACGGDDDDDDVPPTATTGAAPPTATTGAAATTAPGAATTAPGAATTAPDAPTATTAAAAETPTPAGEQPKQGGTLIFAYAGLTQLQSLDPPRVFNGAVAGELIPNIFSSLVQFDEELNVQPDLAEAWTVSDDGLVYTFNVREGLTFHNGDALVAEDFIYTMERTKSEEMASSHANKLKNITEAVAVDDLTLELTFSAPFGPFLAVACSRGPGRALTPVSKRAVEEMGNDEFNLKPVGAGPFMIVPESMDSSVGFDMVAFDGWWGGRPLLDKVSVVLIPDPASALNSLEAGDVDLLERVPAVGVENMRGVDSVALVEVPGTGWGGIQFNIAHAPWDKLDARLAVAKAIDKQEFIDTAFFGLAVVGGPVAPAFAWAYTAPDQIVGTPQAFDLDAAKALAESSGIVGLKPVMLTPSTDDRQQQVIRNMLSEIGVEIQIDKREAAAEDEAWTSGDYDLYITGSIVDADPDDNDFNFFYSTGPWNTGKWVSAESDRILDESRATADQSKRAELFKELQQLLHEQAPCAFLNNGIDICGFQTYVKGYKAIPEMRYLETIWLDK